MSMSDLVNTLLRKKLIKRLPHKLDKRAYSLTLTPRGHVQVLKAIPIVEEIDRIFFTKDTVDLVKLIHNLRHLTLD